MNLFGLLFRYKVDKLLRVHTETPQVKPLKILHNLLFFHLCYNTFSKWLHVMNAKLSYLIICPSHDNLGKTMPQCFQASFRKCVAVINSFKVFIQTPSRLLARASTWSNYKHHKKVKFYFKLLPCHFFLIHGVGA